MIALFEAREEAIDGARDDAKRMEHEAKTSEGGFDEKIRAVRTAANQERDLLRADGLKKEREILERARVDSQRLLEESRKKIQDEAVAARAKIATETPAFANQIASKLLGREVH